MKPRWARSGEGADTGYETGPPPPKIHHNECVVRTADTFNGVATVHREERRHLRRRRLRQRAHPPIRRDGKLLNSWGDIGTGPGQFQLPHGIALDNDENVIVCDRENDRLQFFDRKGKYLTCGRTCSARRTPRSTRTASSMSPSCGARWSRGRARSCTASDNDLPGRVTVFRKDGKIVARFGDDSENRPEPGNFIAPHGIALDSRGNLYVSEVSGTFGGRTKRMPMEQCLGHQIQKFARVR